MTRLCSHWFGRLSSLSSSLSSSCSSSLSAPCRHCRFPPYPYLYGVGGLVLVACGGLADCLPVRRQIVFLVVVLLGRLSSLSSCPALGCYGALSVSAGSMAPTVLLLCCRRVSRCSSSCCRFVLFVLSSCCLRVVVQIVGRLYSLLLPVRRHCVFLVVLLVGRGAGFLGAPLRVPFSALVVFPYPIVAID